MHRALGLALSGLIAGTAAHAQNPAHSHIGHLAGAFVDTPNGQGLLPTAVAEAAVAAQHAGLAAADSVTLDAIRRHAGHVLNALDPTVVASGPGWGYGVRRAASEVLVHIELVAASDSLSENATVHARHVAASAANAATWTEQAIALAQRVQSAPTASAAVSLAAQLNSLCQAITYGRDANRDGRVGWQEGEGGLAQATYHITLMQRGEGLIR